MSFPQLLSEKFRECLYFAGHTLEENSANLSILVAISGGCDSTALLVALKQIASEENLSLTACHINHKLRGKESDQDASFCQKLCQSLDINFDLRNGASSLTSSEEALRDLRYELLLEAARQSNARYIVTAHTLDDQIETILFRLLRGSSSKGLTGIRLARFLADNLFILRPLLTTSKEECRRFLLEKGICAQEDSSNSKDTYTRNYLRNTIVPLIADRFPQFSRTYRTI